MVDTTAVAESSCLSATGARGKTRARTGLLPMDLKSRAPAELSDIKE